METKERSMKTSRTTAKIAVVFASFAAFAALAGLAEAASSRPAAMTRAEHQAIVYRGEAMNSRYGNVLTQLTPAEFKSLWAAGGYRLSPQQFIALVVRSQAMNKMYGHAPALR
jgi:hypothetical protein